MSDASGLNLRLGFAIAAGAIGSSFQHGWATGVVNCPQWFVMSWIRGCNASLPDIKSLDNNNSLELFCAPVRQCVYCIVLQLSNRLFSNKNIIPHYTCKK